MSSIYQRCVFRNENNALQKLKKIVDSLYNLLNRMRWSKDYRVETAATKKIQYQTCGPDEEHEIRVTFSPNWNLGISIFGGFK